MIWCIQHNKLQILYFVGYSSSAYLSSISSSRWPLQIETAVEASGLVESCTCILHQQNLVAHCVSLRQLTHCNHFVRLLAENLNRVLGVFLHLKQSSPRQSRLQCLVSCKLIKGAQTLWDYGSFCDLHHFAPGVWSRNPARMQFKDRISHHDVLSLDRRDRWNCSVIVMILFDMVIVFDSCIVIVALLYRTSTYFHVDQDWNPVFRSTMGKKPSCL